MAILVAITIISVSLNALTTPPFTLNAPGGRDVQVGNARVHFEQWGERGSPIVLVHGFVESTVSWQPAARLLARRHVVYALDLAGYGYTEYTGRYSLNDEISLVAGFVSTLGLRRPVLVGHSLGAAVVGGVALQHPELVGGVIFADGDALPLNDNADGTSAAAWILKTPYAISAYRIVTHWSWLDELFIRSQCGSTCRGLTPELAEAWLRPLRQGAAEQALPAIAARGVLHLAPAEIRAIEVPRAVIWGAEDTRSGGSLTQTRRNLGHPQTIVIPAAGHLSMVADPAAFASAIQTEVAAMPTN